MKGDFTRMTFDPRKRFARVLMQQGRVQTDADWNELNAIVLHYVRTLAADVIGPHGGPNGSFEIAPREDDEGNAVPEDFVIRPGHYYVDGILCENDREVPYTEQPDYPFRESEELKQGEAYLAYLDVWERHITYIEDDSIREVALGGPDTATRTKLVWQVKAVRVEPDFDNDESTRDRCDKLLKEKLGTIHKAKLRARTRLQGKPEDPCITPPEARYRGAENQLYRVEIHTGGEAGEATFKWARDNGSAVYPVRTLKGNVAALEHLGRDNRFSPKVGDWVEVVDDDSVLQGRTRSLLQTDAVDPVDMTVTLEVPESIELPAYGESSTKHPLLRRWDHKGGDPVEGGLEIADDGAHLVQEGDWLTLEDGVQIWFESAQTEDGSEKPTIYRAGDYWLIPARTATGDVEWPRTPSGEPIARPPHGIEHHYAPLATITLEGDGALAIDDCRCSFSQLCVEARSDQ